MASVDNHEVAQLAADLRRAPKRVETAGRKVMKKGALEVKREMAKIFSGHNYAGKVPGSLEFERADESGLAYDVGELDSAGPQWGIAAILAYGTSNNAPVVDFTKAGTREGLVISERMGDAGQDAVLGGGER